MSDETRNRARDLISRMTLTSQDLGRLFCWKHPGFDANLFRNHTHGDAKQLKVTLFNNENKASSRFIIAAKPPFPWFYDLSLSVNISIIVRKHTFAPPTDHEIHWIALNMVKFNFLPTWAFFHCIVHSLQLWSAYLKDVAFQKNDSSWTVMESIAVMVGTYIVSLSFMY